MEIKKYIFATPEQKKILESAAGALENIVNIDREMCADYVLKTKIRGRHFLWIYPIQGNIDRVSFKKLEKGAIEMWESEKGAVCFRFKEYIFSICYEKPTEREIKEGKKYAEIGFNYDPKKSDKWKKFFKE